MKDKPVIDIDSGMTQDQINRLNKAISTQLHNAGEFKKPLIKEDQTKNMNKLLEGRAIHFPELEKYYKVKDGDLFSANTIYQSDCPGTYKTTFSNEEEISFWAICENDHITKDELEVVNKVFQSDFKLQILNNLKECENCKTLSTFDLEEIQDTLLCPHCKPEYLIDCDGLDCLNLEAVKDMSEMANGNFLCEQCYSDL